jgi:benzoate transport
VSTLTRDLIGERPMSPFQIAAVVVGVCLNMLDGFDILAMSFAANGVKSDWHLAGTQLGFLFSAGLVGMGLGSLVLGPVADLRGRRPVVLFSVALAGVGMLGSAATQGFWGLLVMRTVTGFGIGGAIACVAVVVSEFSSNRWRAAALAAFSTGYPIGATLGGLLTKYTIDRYGWQSAFVIGGVMTLLLLPVAWFRLPESLDFLLARQPTGALTRANVLLAAMRLPAITTLPGSAAASRPGHESVISELKLILTPTTAFVWTTFFFTMAAFYFILSWTPRLLTQAGLSATQGLTGGVILNLGGIVGCGGFAIAAAFADARRLLIVSLVGSAILIVLFGLVLAHLDLALWTALFLGIIANSAMSGLYAVGPPLYPAVARATGMGWAIGVGRIGAILAPLLSGALLDSGWQPRQLYFLYALSFAIAVIATLAIGRGARAAVAD